MVRTNPVLWWAGSVCIGYSGCKKGKDTGACLEIAAIVNDWRSQIVGGMETALVLWEACCVPSLLHGAGTWTSISTATEKELNKIQRFVDKN